MAETLTSRTCGKPVDDDPIRPCGLQLAHGGACDDLQMSDRTAEAIADLIGIDRHLRGGEPETAIDRVREFLRIVPIGRPYVGDGTIVSVSGLGGLTIADLRTLVEAAARPAIDAEHLDRQREFSARTFGPGARTKGVLEHIRKELKEIEAAPEDVFEWVDVIILAFDGAWRAGWDPQQIIAAIKAKQEANEARTWPDWRDASPDHAIEHVR